MGGSAFAKFTASCCCFAFRRSGSAAEASVGPTASAALYSDFQNFPKVKCDRLQLTEGGGWEAHCEGRASMKSREVRPWRGGEASDRNNVWPAL